jgi:hypothetical protein
MLTMMLLQFFKAFRPKRLVLTFHGSEILTLPAAPFGAGSRAADPARDPRQHAHDLHPGAAP